jgi:diguanylate cyclase (GGDEF)-like protein
MRCVFVVSALVIGLVAGAPASLASLAASSAGPGVRVDFASPDAVMETSRALSPYHGPVAAGCTDWYVATAVNETDRAATRVLQAGQPPGTGLNFFSAPTRPQIAEVASSDDKVFVERVGAYGHRAFRVTLPPATSVMLAICTSNARRPPSLLAWTEPALSQHNRNLAIFVAAVAGLIGAAAGIVGGLAAMSGHAAPRWAAITLVLVLVARLSATGMFDSSLATPLGGPYGLMALIAGLALASGARLADAVVPLRDFWPQFRRPFRFALWGLVALSAMAFVGIPGAIVATDAVVVIGTSVIAAYLVQCGRMGSLAARVLSPSAAVFALVALAAALTTLGGLGDSLIAGDAAGGFAAAGAVLLALAVAADEGLAGIDIKRLPARDLSAVRSDPSKLDERVSALSSSAIAASHQGLFDLDFDSGALSLSGEAAGFAGFAGRGELDHDEWVARVHPDDLETYSRALSEYRAQPGLAFRLEFRARDANRRFAWLELRATMLGEGDVAARCLGLVADVTARKEAEAALLDRTLMDPLTGLGNRVALMEALEQLGPKLRAALFVLLDIDRFKSIHASLGDAGGDKMLVRVAERLTKNLSASARVFRVGGDAFAALFAEGDESMSGIGNELVACFMDPFRIRGRDVFAPVSAGVAWGRDAEDARELLRNAELALIQAKRRGGSCAYLYSPDLGALAPNDSVALESELRHALEEKQIEVFYQPIVRLSDRSIAGFEALARWLHPKRGVVPPAEFIAHAEKTGLILALGRHVLARATRELAHWQRFFPLEPPMFVSVNVSRRQLGDSELENHIAAALSGGEIERGTLKLEITESAVGSDIEVPHRLERLRSLGAGLSLDDFGTGVSSLSQLRDLPFDTIKIDKSFLEKHGGANENAEAGVILSSIISLALELKRSVVVEGVETERDAQWLKGLGCEFAQGYHFSQPLTASEALKYIAMHFDPATAASEPSPARNTSA